MVTINFYTETFGKIRRRYYIKNQKKKSSIKIYIFKFIFLIYLKNSRFVYENNFFTRNVLIVLKSFHKKLTKFIQVFTDKNKSKRKSIEKNATKFDLFIRER